MIINIQVINILKNFLYYYL